MEIPKSSMVSSTCRFCDVQKHELSRCRGQLFKVVRGSSDEINNCVSKTVLHKHTLDKSGVSQSQRLQSFLITYRTTPHATTGRTPAELFLKRQLRTRLTLLKPNLLSDVQDKQEKLVNNRAQHTPLREFTDRQLVRVKNCVDSGVVKFVLGSIVLHSVTSKSQTGCPSSKIHNF